LDHFITNLALTAPVKNFEKISQYLRKLL